MIYYPNLAWQSWLPTTTAPAAMPPRKNAKTIHQPQWGSATKVFIVFVPTEVHRERNKATEDAPKDRDQNTTRFNHPLKIDGPTKAKVNHETVEQPIGVVLGDQSCRS